MSDAVIKIAWVGLIVLLIDLGCLIAWLVRHQAERAGRAEPLFARKWSLLDAWLASQVVIVLTLVSAVIAIGIVSVLVAIVKGPKSLGADRIMDPGSPLMAISILIILLIQNGFMIAAPLFLIHFRYRESFSALGIKLLPSRRDLVVGLQWGAGLFVVAVCVERIIMISLLSTIGPLATKRLVEINQSITAEGMMSKGMGPGLLAAMLVGGAIAAPIGEEVFFRGFLFNSAKRRFGLTAGVIMSAGVFALIHGGPIAIMAIFPMGILLALAYERSGSLWVPILMHITNNGVALILTALQGK